MSLAVSADECPHADVKLHFDDEAGVWMRATVVDSADSMIQLGHCRDCAREVRRIRGTGELAPWEIRKTTPRSRPPR